MKFRRSIEVSTRERYFRVGQCLGLGKRYTFKGVKLNLELNKVKTETAQLILCLCNHLLALLVKGESIDLLQFRSSIVPFHTRSSNLAKFSDRNSF